VSTVAVVLAAGRGTRMRSELPKPLVPLAGRGLVLRVLDALDGAGVTEQIVVVGHGAAAVREALPQGVHTPLQEVRDGTAAALGCAREAVGDAAAVFVLVGDSPLLRGESLAALARHHEETGAACSFLTAVFPEPPPYARVLRDDAGRVLGCVEERDCTPEQLAIRELLTSHFLFDAKALWWALARVKPHPVTGERYLTDVIEIMAEDGDGIEALRIDDWRELVGLNTPEEVAWAETVWAERMAAAGPPQPPVLRSPERLLHRVEAALGRSADAMGIAPGRINLIGEHTDYIGGLSLPGAIDRHVLVGLAARDDQTVTIHSLESGERWSFELGPGLDPPQGWQRYMAGAVEVFREHCGLDRGFDAAVAGDVPLGAGLSSSAALCVAWMNALRAWTDAELDDATLVRMAQRVEHVWAGVKCGLLDQMASQLARPDHLLRIDFRNLAVAQVPNNLHQVELLVFDTGVRRALAGSAYAERVAQVRAGIDRVTRRGVMHWRDLRLDDLVRGDVIDDRLRHGITENARVDAAAEALRAGDAVALGGLLMQSHQSLQQEYAVSCAELDSMVALAASEPGCFGARMMGGGFGGCVLALVSEGAAESVWTGVIQAYRRRHPHPARAFRVRLVAGARGHRIDAT